jgi:hypothetical protein
MIKICLDTNTLHENWLPAGEAFTFLAELIATGECEIFISEVSILEHVRHYQRKASQIESELKSSLANYDKLFVDQDKPAISPALCDPQIFEKRFRARLKELGIQTLKIPHVSHAELVDRDLAEKKPFLPSGKGYRDALTWLGFLRKIDKDTAQAVVVTNDANDFCADDKKSLHPELVAELKGKNSDCSGMWFASPQKLVDELVKPLLKSLAVKDAKKTVTILKRIQEGKYRPFQLEEVVAEGLENFESQEADGPFYGGDAELEAPIYVATVEHPSEIEAIELYKLSSGHYVCEGIAHVLATVEGYLDHFEAFNQSQQGSVYVSDPNWNEHYSEVEVSNVPAKITFSFEFEDGSNEILKFEVTKVESIREF